VKAGVARVRDAGRDVAFVHLTHLNPLPRNIGEVVRAYPKVVIPEMNLGHLSLIIRGRFLVDARSVAKVQGRPFFAHEIEGAILEELNR
jgi:2-oxoglutarate ferredoxin oxidoreductase subunit alpha